VLAIGIPSCAVAYVMHFVLGISLTMTGVVGGTAGLGQLARILAHIE
jgi:hypothetical protein